MLPSGLPCIAQLSYARSAECGPSHPPCALRLSVQRVDLFRMTRRAHAEGTPYPRGMTLYCEFARSLDRLEMTGINPHILSFRAKSRNLTPTRRLFSIKRDFSSPSISDSEQNN